MIFDCAETPLNVSWDPRSRPATTTDVDAYLPPLFGLRSRGDKGVEAETARNHVFDTEGFPRLVEALRAAARSGSGAVARVALTTVRNDFFGVDAGRSIDLTLVYLDLPQKWSRALPKETARQSAATEDSPETPTISTGTRPRGAAGLLLAQLLLLGRPAARALLRVVICCCDSHARGGAYITR